MAPLQAIAVYGRMIKFSHSVFALPLLAAMHAGITPAQIGWIALAMVGARSAAMGFNRLVDRHLDAANPRTQNRELPRGVVSPQAVGVFVILSALALVLAAYQLNPLCFYLSPLVLAVLLFYSLTKRFTWASHLVLGLSLGGAPLGAWIAVTGGFDLIPLLLCLGVLVWVAGFDIIYACQDHAFDVRAGLHSIPVRFGIARALYIARALHLLFVALLIIVGRMAGLSFLYWLGVVVVAGLLVYEHRLVRADDLSRMSTAFMTVNSTVSLIYFAAILADLLVFGEGELLRF
ncbi:MAG: putative 4-hydroxybenzoate polyprenyltransferase [Candidatus Latescibacteria bacterium]|nr:putative 4-hydroxybenzoate polyprenyltransferase [Candidatus Latescibacterota bacterium]